MTAGDAGFDCRPATHSRESRWFSPPERGSVRLQPPVGGRSFICHSVSAMTSPALRLLVLKSRQLEQVRDFYALIGIEFAVEKHGSGPEHHAGRLGDFVLELYPLVDGQTPVNTTLRLGFAVADLNGVVDSLAATGARIVRPPAESEWGRRAVVVDPDGRNVELYEP